MSTDEVKTGFWMPRSYSERAQAIAKSRGQSMRTFLVDAIGIGLAHFETPKPVTLPPPTVIPASTYTTADLTADLLSLAQLTISTPKPQATAPQVKIPAPPVKAPRHKPERSTAKSWRFK